MRLEFDPEALRYINHNGGTFGWMAKMPNFIVNHTRRPAVILSEDRLWSQLISSAVLMLLTAAVALLNMLTSFL